MPSKQYPFIDIAVHERVRSRFAAGQALVLFSDDMEKVLWANGAGASLFNHEFIYDFLDAGLPASDVTTRQIKATTGQLSALGDQRSFLMRMTTNFQRVTIQATVEMIPDRAGDRVILFSAPVSEKPLPLKERAKLMLSGFDDPDTHMAVLGDGGEILASSAGFDSLAVKPDTIRTLLSAVSRDADQLLKRPVPTGRGYLPAAIGQLSEDPALSLLFCVEIAIGQMDPTDDDTFSKAEIAAVADEPVAQTAVETPEPLAAVTVSSPAAPAIAFDDALDAVAHIEDGEDEPVEAEAIVETRSGATYDLPVKNDLSVAAMLKLLDGATDDDLSLSYADEASSDMADLAAMNAQDAFLNPAPLLVPGIEAPATAEDTDRYGTVEPVETDHGTVIDGPESAIVAETDNTELQADPGNADGQDAQADQPGADEQTETFLSDTAEQPVGDVSEPAPVVEVAAAEAIDEIADAPADQITDAAEDVFASPDAIGETVLDGDSAEITTDVTDTAVAATGIVEPAIQDAAVPAEAPAAFAYRRNARPVRFVWKVDAHGKFSEISEEFADAVGPNAADINEKQFVDVARAFKMDPDGKIAELLQKRDTWSGKTIFWPVENTSLRVPVDLAALPTYSRSRSFDGFRGFGIVRLADAIEDPDQIGLSFAKVPHADPADLSVHHDVEVETSDLEPEFVTVPHADVAETEAEVTREAEELSFAASVAETGEEIAPDQDLAINAEEPAAEPVADTATETGALANDDDAETAIEPAADAVPADAEPLTSDGDEAEIASIGEEIVADTAPDAAETGSEPAFMEETTAIEAAADDVAGESVGETPETPSDVTGNFSAPDDDFRGERPALRLVETPGRRHSDKVVSFEAHRGKPRDGLTLSEQAAFNEIARQLDPFGKRILNDTKKDELPVETASLPQENALWQPEDTAGDEAAATPSGPVELAGTTSEPAITAEDVAGLIPSRTNSDEKLTAKFVDALPLAILVHTGETLIHGNPEFFRLTGYQSLKQLQDYGGIDALLEQDQSPKAADETPAMMLVTEAGTLEPVTARLQSVRWEDSNALLLALVPQRPDHIRQEAAAAMADPVPAPEEQVKALQIEVDELRSILETATDGVVIVGQDGDIRSMNRSASALFNFDDEDTRGKSFAMLFAHESQKAVMDYLAGLSGHGVASVLNDGREVIGREASGGFIPLFMTMGRLSSSNGYCAVIRDITQWKRTEEELRTAKRAAETANAHKSEFLARVSHEIRTPLNAIIGFSAMMATERLGPIGHPRYVEYSDDIGRSGRHVLDIVNDLLDISKIEAGEMELDFTAVELNEAVSEAVSLVQPQVNSQRVIIRTSLSQSVPNIVADQRSIKQIAINILANAIRYTPAGGQIVVSTAYESNGSVVLRIRDTGIGMTRTELEQALKPFRQVTTGSRKRGDGTGLGLPLTKAMVDANRANFAISSTPNEGTLVEITFPSQRVLAN